MFNISLTSYRRRRREILEYIARPVAPGFRDRVALQMALRNLRADFYPRPYRRARRAAYKIRA